MDDPDRPLIVTLALEESAFRWFHDLRRAHFPPDRNLIPAHLTLFHKLPGAEAATVLEGLRSDAAETPPMSLQVTGPWSLGRGVAYRLASPALLAFRAGLAQRFDAWLTPQDRGGFRPHVTVQNKADPAEARRLLETLQAEFEPFEVAADGVLLWRYLGGPWEPLARMPFSGPRRSGG